MTNSIYHRLVVRGVVVVPHALHIGSGSASRLSDAAIRRGPRGQLYIPGSSLAGILRSMATELAPWLVGQIACQDRRCGKCSVCKLFGHTTERERGEGAASRVFVEDAYLVGELPERVEVREHVGVDRRRGAARARLLYDREVTPGNTLYRFEMSVEEPMADDLRLLLFILDFWQTYGFHVGGRTTTGLGEARLEDLKFFGLDFSNPAVLRDYLLRGDPKVAEEYLPPAAEITFVKLKEMAGRLTAAPESVADTDAFLPQHLFLTIALEPLDPLLVGGNVPKLPPEAGEARVSDTEFVTALRAEDGEVLYIPGSALKGVFRTRAEKIIRTLNFYRGYPTAEDAHSNIEAAEQAYQERICACAVTHARKETEEEPERLWACFGTRKEQRKAAGADGRAVYEASCLTCRLFGNTMMRGRIAFSDASLMEEMEARLKLFDHVAIDRFTGGAAEAKKFDTRPLLPGDGPLFTFGIHLERFEPWMVGLLAYLLKDLHTGDIRLGRATHRGYGRIRGQVTQAELLVLQGSELYQICESAGLDLGEEFGPYHKVILDLPTLFGPKQWPEEGPDTVSPTARFLQACDEVFQAIVREEEGKEHGEVQGE